MFDNGLSSIGSILKEIKFSNLSNLKFDNIKLVVTDGKVVQFLLNFGRSTPLWMFKNSRNQDYQRRLWNAQDVETFFQRGTSRWKMLPVLRWLTSVNCTTRDDVYLFNSPRNARIIGAMFARGETLETVGAHRASNARLERRGRC